MPDLRARKRVIALADFAEQRLSRSRGTDRISLGGGVRTGDWQTMLASRVADLLEIFEGARVGHLVVLESESASRARVRGLVHRSRVERRLHPPDDKF